MHTLIPRWTGLVFLFSGLVPTGGLRAQDAAKAFLLNPATALTGGAPGQVEAALAPRVDGTGLSFADPQILIYKDTDSARFISAIWKDAAGRPLHQRDVFLVKPDYGVIVDFVYGEGQHDVMRGFDFLPGVVVSDSNGVQVASGGEKTFRVQAIDAAAVTIVRGASGQRAEFSRTVKTPAPFATAFVAWTGNAAPKIEFVKAGNPMVVKYKVTFPGGRVDLGALAWEDRPLHLNGIEYSGWAACSRASAAGTSLIEIH